MDGYAAFLEGKVKDEHGYTHLLQQEVASLREKVVKMLGEMAVLRKAEGELRLRSRQAEERIADLQLELKKAKEGRNALAREATQRRERRAREEQGPDHKQIFRSYLDNTFPRNKGTIKKLLKAFFVLEQRDSMQPLQKIKFYQAIFEGFVKKVLDWLFPKRTENEKAQSIAQNLVKEWKQREGEGKILNEKTESAMVLSREVEYIERIEKLEAQALMLRSGKGMLQSRLKTYERGLQIKGGEFVVHLRKMLQEDRELEPEAHQRVEEIITLFTAASRPTEKREVKEEEGPLSLQTVPAVLSTEKQGRRKAAPVLKKNIYGYYQDPQFASGVGIGPAIRHPNPHKSTQTMPEDLCVLTPHPVILLTLIDGSIRPQRTRHSAQYFVRVHVSGQTQVDSGVREGLEIVWNEPFLLKDYDFPFLRVALMHRSKGLRDNAVGEGRLAASKAEEKVVNVRREKEFQGRVRFSLTYPKGNIYELRITSVRLMLPPQAPFLKEEAALSFPFNPKITVDFAIGQMVVYLERSVIILESSEQSLSVNLVKSERRGGVPLREVTGQEGSREVVVDVGDNWKVVIQGELFLLICEEEEPEPISEQLLQGGRGKFFSVRAPPPIQTVSYASVLLHASIKFPLVFAFSEQFNRMSIVRELPNREITEQVVEPVVREGQLRLSEIIKAPGRVYRFFVEQVQGQEVRLRHESALFERLLREVQLQVSYREGEAQEVDYARKHRSKQEPLFKEFAIETKELMLNHYRVFSRHFKRIGFVKFKLGYAVYENELQEERMTELPSKDSRRLDPVPQGTYFVEVELSEAHLPSKGKGSSFSCVVNGETSSVSKGNHPQWGESFIIALQFLENFEAAVSYEVWQEGTFGRSKIYEGKLVINEKALTLGIIIVSLSAEDCLHFSRIRVPEVMVRLSIGVVQAEIKEEADWIGKIDPYVTLSCQSRQILKTEYLDNKGSHPVWTVNREITIPLPAEENSALNCKLYDYDLVGRDDYLGEASVTGKLNPELLAGSCEILYANLVKENRICGSLRLRGSFERFEQQPLRLPQAKMLKLGKNDKVYLWSIYQVRCEGWREFKEDQGTISVKVNGSLISEKHFDFNQKSLESFTFTHWVVNSQVLEVEFKRTYKSFFKVFTESLGSFTLTTSGEELSVGRSAIMNASNREVGGCCWYIEPQDKVKYGCFGSFISCRQAITAKSDLEHQLSLPLSFSQSPFLFYHKLLSYYSYAEEKEVELAAKAEGKAYGLHFPQSQHTSIVACFSAEMENVLQTEIKERSERANAREGREYKQLSCIHWEPFQYETTSAYRLNLKFSAGQAVTLKQELTQVYNEYIPIKPFASPLIFQAECTPSSVEVVNARTGQIEATIPVQQQTKVFLPSKGALYYRMEDYNLKSIMELNFSCLLIRFRDRQMFKQCQQARLTLTSSLTLNSFSCPLMPLTNSFLLQDLKLLVAQPPHSTTLFFEATVSDQDNRELTRFKFGLRMQPNREQYRVVDSQEYFIHASFSCLLIERNYDAPPKQDNTIYGMSFIDLQEVEFEANEDPSSKRVFVQIALGNQNQKQYLEREPATDIHKSQTSSIFYIERSSVAEMTIIEEGVLSNSVLGSASIAFSQTLISREKVSIDCEVYKDRKIVGKLTVRYTNMKEVPFLDVNMFTHISQSSAMVAELQEFGPAKQKTQKMLLTSRGDVARLESEDSFIVTRDPREYEVTVSEKESNKLLGEFKLSHELATGGRLTVLQPLRTSMNSLNGVLVIEYVMKQSSNVTWEANRDRQTMLLELTVSRITFKHQKDRLKDLFSLRLRTPLRENKSKLQTIDQKTCITFTIYDHQSCEIGLMDKSELIGMANFAPPYLESEQRTILLTKDSKSVGIVTFSVRYFPAGIYSKMREIRSIEATNLLDTQLFTKMTPFIELEPTTGTAGYATELGLGKEKIFWRVNLITSEAMRLTVKDKDMFYDDLVGRALLEGVEAKQSEDKTYELSLSSEEESRKGGNGILKISTTPVTAQANMEAVPTVSVKEVMCFLFQLGGLGNSELVREADSIEVSLRSAEGRISLLREKYDDLFFYLSNKDVEVEFDTYFTGLNKDELQIFVNLMRKDSSIYEQTIGGKSKKSKDLFSICTLTPLERQFLYFQRIHLWMFDKVAPNLEAYLTSQTHYEKLRIAKYQKYLMVLEPKQLRSFSSSRPLTLLLRQGAEVVYQFPISLDSQLDACRIVASGSIINKSKEVGLFFAQIGKFYSHGEQIQRRTMIGKSRRKWLNLRVCEALLTKDLEIFSKMDPYCKFGPADNPKSWRQTGVQENIGLHPIWNESFLVQIDGEGQEFIFVVMDEEVTADRAVGQGKATVKALLQAGSKGKEVQLFFKGNEASGSVRVETAITTSYIIFRNISSADEKNEFYFFHEENRQAEKGRRIELGVVYPISAGREVRVRFKDSLKTLIYSALKEQQGEGIAFGEECACLYYDLYE